MPKIKEFIQLRTGYANFVELKSAFAESRENADRMAMYRPTKAHRRAFERLARGLQVPTDKKFYLLSGSYGTGKSHLTLMFANFVSRSSGDPEMRGFYENYAKLDAETAEKLRNNRKGGQYLVAICDYDSGRQFEDTVLDAVFQACEERGLEARLETQHREAERLLEQWEANQKNKEAIRDFYADFGKALTRVSGNFTVEQLRIELRKNNSEALENFFKAYRECMGGTEFQPQAGNIVAVITELVKSKAFKEKFAGLAILFDEFGYVLEEAAYSKRNLHGFMEKVCQQQHNVVFVGCIHKDFKAYATKMSQADINVMDARKTQVDLISEGIEEIIGAILEVDKSSPIWRDEVEPKLGVFDNLLPTCEALGLFPWISDQERIREKVLEDIYGVHPMTLACLLKLSGEVGSSARSTFTFFAGEAGGHDGSYTEFIEEAELTVDGGKLNLYTVDRLFRFFAKELALKNPDLRDRQRQAVNGYISSLEAYRKSPEGQQKQKELKGLFDENEDLTVRLLRTALIYQLCQIPATAENFYFGLYALSVGERKAIDKDLKALEKSGALFYRQQSKTYELAVAAGEDPYDLIDRYVQDEANAINKPLEAYLRRVANPNELNWLEAKQYNLTFGEDKRLKKAFVLAKDLSDHYWKTLAKELEDTKDKENVSFEGHAVYVLCEDSPDLKRAQEAARKIPAGHPVVVAVPYDARPFEDSLLKVEACLYYLNPGSGHNLSAQTESRLQNLFDDPGDGFLTQLKRHFREIHEGENATWYGNGGEILIDRPKKSHEPADQLMETLFKKRCRINHPDLNFRHDNRWRSGGNTALKQAVNMLLQGMPVQIDAGNPGNHGEKRYLEKVLLKGAGALRKTGSEGTVSYFSCESNVSKISENFTALKVLMSRVDALDENKDLPLGPFFAEMGEPPFGIGHAALCLAFAQVLRSYGERVRVFKDSSGTEERTPNDLEGIVEIVQNLRSNAVLRVRKIQPAERLLIEETAKVLGANPLKYGEDRRLSELVGLLTETAKRIPPVARLTDLYGKKDQQGVSRILSFLDSAKSTDRFDLILRRLPEIYLENFTSGTIREEDVPNLAAALKSDLALVFGGEQRALDTTACTLGPLFGRKDCDLIALAEAVEQWFAALSPRQREAHRYEDCEEADIIVRCLASSDGTRSQIVEKIPEALGFGPIREWKHKRDKDLKAKWEAALKAVDANAKVLPKPSIEPGEGLTSEGKNHWSLDGKGSARIRLPEGTKNLIYTFDGSDPKGGRTREITANDIQLTDELIKHPSITVIVRTVDDDGNYSDPVSFHFLNKANEYGFIEENELFGKKLKVKKPEDVNGFRETLRSLLVHGERQGFIPKDVSARILAIINDLPDS